MEPIRDSIKQVDSNSWLVGELLLTRSFGMSATGAWYDQGCDANYTLAKAPSPPPAAVPLPPNETTIKLVHTSADCAVWSIGSSALCKVRLQPAGTTLESTTIAYVRKKRPAFGLPTILHASEANDRSYVFMGRLPGRTLAEAWPTLNDKWKARYVNSIANACKDMSSWERDKLSGVDGRGIAEPHLSKQASADDFSREDLLKGCEAAGMDCSKFVFVNGGLRPSGITVENHPLAGNISIIDWDRAGYLPKDWVRTKFRISSDFDLPGTDDPTDFRREVQRKLGEVGFSDCADAFKSQGVTIVE